MLSLKVKNFIIVYTVCTALSKNSFLAYYVSNLLFYLFYLIKFFKEMLKKGCVYA